MKEIDKVVAEFKNKNFELSLKHLEKAYRIIYQRKISDQDSYV